MKPPTTMLAPFTLCAVALMCTVRAHAQGPDPQPVFPIHHRDPAWSRQGLVAYEDRGIFCVYPSGGWREADSLRGLWVLNPETGERRRVLAWGWTPSWSGDGQMLAFGYGRHIFTLDLASGVVTQLTTTGWNTFPSWSPDGEWIAYQSEARIWLMRSDGTSKHAVGPDQCWYPSWSSDGRRILHVRGLAEGGAVFSMDINGENGVRIHDIPTEDQIWKYPQYSPDGSRIAADVQLLNDDTDVLPEIWVLDVDGTGVRRLTTQGGSHPSWSPDGTEIIFSRADAFRNAPEDGVLWIVDPKTGVQRQVTSRWPEQCPTPVAKTSWSDIKNRFR